MTDTRDPRAELAAESPDAELRRLRVELADAHQALDAIRTGDVDALVVPGDHGGRVFTLAGADTVYRQLIEGMIEGALTLAADGTILYCNESVAALLGYPIQTLLGTGFGRYLSPEDRRVLATMLADSLQRPSRGELLIACADGTRRLVNLSISRLKAETGGQLFCLVAADLTESRRHELVAAAERLARSILDQSAEMIVVCDGEGRIIRLSQTAELLFGPQPLHRPFAEILALRGEDGVLFDLVAVLRGATVRNVDLCAERDGVQTDVLLSAGPLRDGARLLGCVVNLVDITDRRRATREARLRLAALEAAANAMLITDRTGSIVWANAAFLSMSGYTADEAVGRNPRELVRSGAMSDAFYREMWTTILAGEVWHGEITNRRKDESRYEEDLTITPVRSESGAITHFIALTRDLTLEHEVQQRLLQSQRLETVGRLAGGVAHDFNNVLTVIGGIVELALDEVPVQLPLHDDLVEVEHAVARAAALTRQLLAFSRKQLLQFTIVDVNALVRNLLKMLQRLIGEDIAIELALADDLGNVRADAGQLEQVIVNFTVNARDAMPHGGHIVFGTRNVAASESVTVREGLLPPGAYVELSVCDTGVGMSAITLASIFEPFFTTKGPGKGTGLGLATVHGIVAQSGGAVQVTSTVGTGSTFRVYLPRVDAPVAVAVPAPGGVAHVTPGGEVVLVVDDETRFRDVTARLLTRAGFAVLTAASGEAALLLLADEAVRVHLLLTDVVLSGMQGPALADAVARVRPGIKVLFMSGYTDDTVLRHGVNAHTSQFIEKPFTLQKLAAKVRKVLDGGRVSGAHAAAT